MDLIAELKKNGYRITKARTAVCSILENSGHFHLTAEEIFKRVKTKSKVIPSANSINEVNSTSYN